jgi:hypothetical protein
LGGIFLDNLLFQKKEKTMAITPREMDCHFIEKCPYVNGCKDKTTEDCYQFELMSENLRLAETLPCPECPSCKCDNPESRALLVNIRECLHNGKCILRQMPEISPFEFNPEFSPKPKFPELKGMQLRKTMRQFCL